MQRPQGLMARHEPLHPCPVGLPVLTLRPASCRRLAAELTLISLLNLCNVQIYLQYNYQLYCQIFRYLKS